MLTIVLLALGALLMAAGLIGCVLPVLPGPPLSWLGLLLLDLAYGGEPFSAWFLVGTALLALVATLLDFVVPALGASRAGATRAGVWGSVAGMILGTIFLGPFGMVLGALLGALVGELLAGRSDEDSFRAAWGVFTGTMAGIIIKLVASGVMTWFFVSRLIDHATRS